MPEAALHAHYAAQQAYLDCYSTPVPGAVSHAQFVAAFYTTWLFKLERWILGWSVKKPSTDEDALRLSRGEVERFAAWSVEARATDQLLMRDFLGATRSWLMVAPDAAGTRLYFGSVVTARTDARTGRREIGRSYRALMAFHKLYSRLLLRAARARVLGK